MAGTIDIRNDAVWMPAGWVFDNTLEFIAAELQHSDPELAAQLADSRTDVGGGYLDLRTLNTDKFRAILSAVDAIKDRLLKEGPSKFSAPTFFDGFMNHLNDLKMAMQTDPRARQD